jgi:hypothetical protein
MADFPTTLTPSSVRAIRRTSSRMAMSPFNFTQQVHDFVGRLRVVEFQYPPLSQSDAAIMEAFLESCDGVTNTFSVDLDDYFPNSSPGSVSMRLASSDFDYDINTAMTYGFSFVAIEAK